MTERESIAEAMARRTIRAACRWLVARRLDLTVEGGAHVPRGGPALVAARHVHHLYDGCALIAALPRPTFLVVASDWFGAGPLRRVMGPACRLARWPTVTRTEALAGAGTPAARSAWRASRLVTRLLRAGHLVVIFPEGYPIFDPAGGRAPAADAILPFRPGLARLAALAERRGAGPIPIVPAGLAYERGARWRVDLRFGPPLLARDHADWQALTRAVEARVIDLSHPPSSARRSPGRSAV